MSEEKVEGAGTGEDGGAASDGAGDRDDGASGGEGDAVGGEEVAESEAGDELLRRAAREVRAEARLAALVPLSKAERAAMAAAVMGLVDAGRGRSGGAPKRAAIGRRPLWLLLAAALALGAALLLWKGVVGPREPELVAYALEVRGDEARRGDSGATGGANAGTMRSAAEAVHLRPETRLLIGLTPEAPVRDVALRLALVRGGQATLHDAPSKHDGRGGFEIDGNAGTLLGAQSDGAAELVVVLGRALPDDEAIRGLALGAAVPSGLRVVRRAVVLEGFSHAAIEVWLGGCRAVRGGAAGEKPVCEIAAGKALRLWLGARIDEAGGIVIAIDGRPIATAGRAVGGGIGLDVTVPEGASDLVVRIAGVEVQAWRLAAAVRFAKVEAAEAARLAGDGDAAVRLLGEIADGHGAEGLAAARLGAKLARGRGDVEGERALRERAIAIGRGLGEISAEAAVQSRRLIA